MAPAMAIRLSHPIQGMIIIGAPLHLALILPERAFARAAIMVTLVVTVVQMLVQAEEWRIDG